MTEKRKPGRPKLGHRYVAVGSRSAIPSTKKCALCGKNKPLFSVDSPCLGKKED